MRKYQQLLLLVTSVVSLSLLLIYRHEYNRLHYVLEVFNFFGQPISCNITELSTFQYDYGPTPVFQEVEDTYLYSAFLVENQNTVQVLAIQKDVNEVKRSCYLWYEDVSKPVIGKYKFSKINKENLDLTYMYYCSYNTDNHTPYAVSFTYKNKRNSDLKKIIINSKHGVKLRSNITLCVLPSDYDKNLLLEFISFHRVIGIEDFILYANDIPYRITSILNNLSTKLDIKLTFYNWNYPKVDFGSKRDLIEQDCLLRTKGHTKTVVTLDLSEYIVPTYHHSLYKMIKDFDVGENTNRFSLPVLKFCISSRDRREPITLQNVHVDQSNENDNKLVRYIYRSDTSGDVINTQAVTKGIASIHSYVDCVNPVIKSIKDESILRFASDLRETTLVHLLMHNGI